MRSKIIALLITGGLAAGLVAPRSAHAVSLDYTVSVNDLKSKRLDITLQMTGIGGDHITLRGIPTYVDNPTAAARTALVENLSAATTTGEPLDIRHISDGTREVIYTIDNTRGADVVISYTVFVDFMHSAQTSVYTIILAQMDDERGWLYGNTTFCTPELAPDRRFALRVPADITVTFEMAKGIGLAGVPGGKIALHNIYELMSLQFGVGSYYAMKGSVAGVDYETIFRDEEEFSKKEREHLHKMTHQMIAHEVDFWGGAPFPYFGMLYVRQENTGGLESSNVCQNYMPADLDATDTTSRRAQALYGVAVHELFHTWNPIYLMAIEDPWIKEGVSSYYDAVLGSRLGYTTEAPDSSWNPYFKHLEDNPRMGAVTLTDPELWDNEYEGEDWRTITYDRGAVVALLLDVFIREASDNKRCLDDVMRALYASYVHVGYTHAQLLETIAASTGADAGDFFADYVDGMRLATRDEVLAAVDRAKQLGVFKSDS